MSEAVPTQTGVSVPAPAPEPSTGVPANSVGPEQLQNEAVIFGKIAANAVNATAIAAGAVTESKIGGEAVASAKIKNEAVSEGKLAKAVVEKLVPGAWKALEGLNKVEDNKASGTQEIGVRIEDGAMARLRGQLKSTAKIPVGTKIFQLPAGVRPPKSVFVVGAISTINKVFTLKILENGEVLLECEGEFPEADNLCLDGMTWNLT